jgi:exodeoxyribonuclease V alpha subunit
MEQIVGVVERLTFQSHENGFTVAHLLQPKYKDTTCIVGSMPTIRPGETVRCFGRWKQHPSFGQQFEVLEYKVEAPADVFGIKKYLGSGLIKGIGPAYAGRIVDLFGKQTLDIIDLEPERLHEVEGIGKKRVELIKACWTEQKQIRDVMLFLQTHGISPGFAQKIFKHYGQSSIAILKENPYRLAQDIWGIGFLSADKAAQKLGIAKDSKERIRAGILFSLNKLSDEGHVCYPVHLFLPEAELMLEIAQNKIEEELSSLLQEEAIVIEKLLIDGKLHPCIWSKMHYASEIGIANEIKRLQLGRSKLRQIDTPKAVEWVQGMLKISLAENQKKAVSCALETKVNIITGGPGTGKSTITNAILRISEKLTDKIILAAPTGRAAKRMTEITGKPAKTIHSLLEFHFSGGFKKNRDNPLDCDLLIVDEASMIDTFLMYSLLKAIPSHCRVIFVGDINQLPSVGPGNVLQDLIHANTISTTTLNEIFRQAQGSQIITNAHKINMGIFPDIKTKEESDFFFIQADDPEVALNNIVTLVSHRIPKKFHFDPIDQIQVLAPMRRGVIGTENLNRVLQETLNPGKEPVSRYGRSYCLGDKVMQIRNNYDKQVYNGDVGRISHIDLVDQELVVTIDDREVIYDFSELDELVLAYAVSIHKYQGSETPCVVIPIHTTHFKLLHRNLLYTGVTRGKKLVVIVGNLKGLAIAVKNDEVKRRYTGLKIALCEKALGRLI